jgi:apolipoprotein N-acyltransferase
LHLDWDLSWPWLNLGNVFASNYKIIQWYEFTGVFGGTAWVLLVNILLFKILKYYQETNIFSLKRLSLSLALIFIPIIISVFTYYNYEEKGKEIEIIAIQPNVDPYTEQYSTPANEMIHNILTLSRSAISDKTKCIIAPESAIQEGIWESDIENTLSADSIRSFLRDYPQLNFIIGASTRRAIFGDEKPTSDARKYPYENDEFEYYYSHNTAINFQHKEEVEYYHKSKLVPGVEQMPFKSVLKHIDKIAIDLGGTTGTLGKSDDQYVFTDKNGEFSFAPIICYESVYGEFVNRYVRNGANILTIITNDGWWGNTNGHIQHYEYARLRAIENRRSIARSANTGISGFFNQRGDDFLATEYEKRDVIKHTLKANNKKTFYNVFGDYFGRLSLFSLALLSLIGIVVRLKGKSKSY